MPIDIRGVGGSVVPEERQEIVFVCGQPRREALTWAWPRCSQRCLNKPSASTSVASFPKLGRLGRTYHPTGRLSRSRKPCRLPVLAVRVGRPTEYRGGRERWMLDLHRQRTTFNQKTAGMKCLSRTIDQRYSVNIGLQTIASAGHGAS